MSLVSLPNNNQEQINTDAVWEPSEAVHGSGCPQPLSSVRACSALIVWSVITLHNDSTNFKTWVHVHKRMQVKVLLSGVTNAVGVKEMASNSLLCTEGWPLDPASTSQYRDHSSAPLCTLSLSVFFVDFREQHTWMLQVECLDRKCLLSAACVFIFYYCSFMSRNLYTLESVFMCALRQW